MEFKTVTVQRFRPALARLLLNTFGVPSNRCDRQIKGIRIWSRSGPGVQRSGFFKRWTSNIERPTL